MVKITQETPLPVVVEYLARLSGIADLTDELSNSMVVSPYAVANGGYSDVYRATRRTGTQVAIKCLRHHDPKHVKRTARELNTWSKLKHQNILELSGLGLFQGNLAMVSPWMERGSVNMALQQSLGLDRYKLCYQLASVVEYLHEENVIHGDIKGDNLLVAHDGTLKITDFGLAIMQDTILQFSLTDQQRGTLRWMAPELFHPEPQRSCEADVYAMGMTMLEILTGDIPFREIEFDYMVIAAVVQDQRKPNVPELTREPVSHQAGMMHRALQWCWEYAPNERPTASQVAILVKGLESG